MCFFFLARQTAAGRQEKMPRQQAKTRDAGSADDAADAWMEDGDDGIVMFCLRWRGEEERGRETIERRRRGDDLLEGQRETGPRRKEPGRQCFVFVYVACAFRARRAGASCLPSQRRPRPWAAPGWSSCVARSCRAAMPRRVCTCRGTDGRGRPEEGAMETRPASHATGKRDVIL